MSWTSVKLMEAGELSSGSTAPGSLSLTTLLVLFMRVSTDKTYDAADELSPVTVAVSVALSASSGCTTPVAAGLVVTS